MPHLLPAEARTGLGTNTIAGAESALASTKAEGREAELSCERSGQGLGQKETTSEKPQVQRMPNTLRDHQEAGVAGVWQGHVATGDPHQSYRPLAVFELYSRASREP